MKSYRGPHGGVMLERPAEEITLEMVVVAIDGPEIFQACVLGMPGCGERIPCPLHESWSVTRQKIQRLFSEVTLSELARRIHEGHLRLSGDEGDPDLLAQLGIA